jgi:hypothetical protein
MVESTEHRPPFNTAVALNSFSIGRILPQREVRAHCIVILHVAPENVAKVPLACHHDMVQAFPANRTDQPLRVDREAPGRAPREML